ncbi:MAG TPA: 4-hydroxy-tetrahydrodipicolinate reductase [Bacteroidia bacterium]|nr:4-hydroxy-tetrahydrodipicolinate reductase [Bacteroidia bacterium]
MKIALIGYGKMGRELEQIALERKHDVVLKVDEQSFTAEDILKLKTADAALEFSVPASAYSNIVRCFNFGVPVVSGTTGWTERMEEIKSECKKKSGAFFYAPNFSIGVNIFFELNRKLASLMGNQNDYEPSVREIHHVHKKDKPSGTAIQLANDILRSNANKKKWKLTEQNSETSKEELMIIAEREDEVPGFHEVKYVSDVDDILITHNAHSRKGFAIGAMLAAEWLQGKKGVFGMSDLLKL